MLTEQIVIDKIEVLEDGTLQIRRARRIFDDATLLAEAYDRHVLTPGEKTADAEDPRVRAIVSVVHTPEVIAAFQRAQKERQRPRGDVAASADAGVAPATDPKR